jgi:hypothetical protein
MLAGKSFAPGIGGLLSHTHEERPPDGCSEHVWDRYGSVMTPMPLMWLSSRSMSMMNRRTGGTENLAAGNLYDDGVAFSTNNIAGRSEEERRLRIATILPSRLLKGNHGWKGRFTVSGPNRPEAI